jgi:hypothetical protein
LLTNPSNFKGEERTGDDGAAAAVAILEDLQEAVAGHAIERLEAPIVEDETIDATERAKPDR